MAIQSAEIKFLDFFYQDEWKAQFDELVGFPPVTMSAAKLPQFQTPLYKALGEAALNAKGWPLMEGFAQVNDIIWNANGGATAMKADGKAHRLVVTGNARGGRKIELGDILIGDRRVNVV